MGTYPNHHLINTDTATAYLGPLLALVVETLCYSELATGILKIGGSFLRQKEAGGKKLFIDFGVERSAIKLPFAGLVYAIVHGSDGIEIMETMCKGSFLLGSATLETTYIHHACLADRAAWDFFWSSSSYPTSRRLIVMMGQ